MENKTDTPRIKDKTPLYFFLVFLIFVLTIKVMILLDGRVYVWIMDGASQHLSALTYYSSYLREILSGLVHGDMSFPRWDLSIGEGSDILTTFHYYCIGDPLAVLSVFFRPEQMHICYEILIYIRMFLTGISFILFVKAYDGGALRTKVSDAAVVTGTVMYAFSGWVLMMSNRHPYFVNPMILMPLILCGVEYIIKRRKRGFLAVAVMISALSNLYFLYMMALLTVIYVAVRLFILYRKDIRTMMARLGIIAAEAVIGLIMGCIVFYPVAAVFLSDSRVGGGIVDLFYPLDYYQSLPQALVSGYWSYYLYIGIGFIGIAVIYFAFARKGHNELRVFFPLAGLFLLFPVFGWILNGFTYAANRWAFVIPLIGSIGLASLWNEVSRPERKDLIWLGGISVVCLAGCIFMNDIAGIVMTVVGIAAFIILFAVKNENVRSRVLPCAVIASHMALLVIYNNSWLDQLAPSPWLSSYYFENEAQYIAGISTDDTVRYSGDELTENVSPIAQVSSTQFYWSNANPNVGEFRNDIASPEYRLYYYNGYNASNILINLAGCAYYARFDKCTEPVPYGFTAFDRTSTGYTMCSNDIPAGIVYSYSDLVGESFWKGLGPVDRQVLIKDTLVVPDGDADAVTADLESAYVGLQVTKDEEGIATIRFDGKPDSETYIVFSDLPKLEVDGFLYLWIHIPKTNEYYVLRYYNYSSWYNGRNQFVLNLGWHEEAIDEITVTPEFGFPYTCSFDMACIPMTEAQASLSRRFEDAPDVKTEDRGTVISFDTDSDTDKYYVLATPYSSGWNAYIDGVKTDIVRANIQYMAVKVPAGHHEIRYEYKGDYDTGALISCAGIVIFAIYTICGRISKDKKRQE